MKHSKKNKNNFHLFKFSYLVKVIKYCYYKFEYKQLNCRINFNSFSIKLNYTFVYKTIKLTFPKQFEYRKQTNYDKKPIELKVTCLNLFKPRISK